jgi:hypothetical protein
MGKSLNDHHTDGQRDGSRGEGFNKPHGIAEELTTWPGTEKSQRNIAENNAYRDGWRNGNKQR